MALSTLTSSHCQQLVTLALEYRDPVVLKSNLFCASSESKVAKDLAFLGLPRPSEADIELREEGRVDAFVSCSSIELERVNALEFGWEAGLNVRKVQCGIKRVWSLSRKHNAYWRGHKRSCAELASLAGPAERYQKRLRMNTHPQTRSLSGSSPSPIRSLWSQSISLSNLVQPSSTADDHPQLPLQSRESSRGEWSNMADGFELRAISGGTVSGAECTSEVGNVGTNSLSSLFRIQRLDPSEVPPVLSPTTEEVPDSRTQDPRLSRQHQHSVVSVWGIASSSCEDEQAGYKSGTCLMLVETREISPCGAAAKARRQFERETRREVELRKAVERERDEAREQVRTLETQLKLMKLDMRGGETCLGVTGMEQSRSLDMRIEEVRRECRHPFVVSALLDAFLKMGELTDRVLEPEGTS